MKTVWKSKEVSSNFDAYNDMLENILGFSKLLEIIQKDTGIKTILDFGCGPGKVSQRIAKLNPNYKIFAVDQSENMIEIASTNRSHENIHYQLIRDDNLSFLEPKSIDCAIVCFVFINNSSKERVANILSEIHRVLKDNGTLMILDSNPDATGIEFSTFTNGIEGKIYSVGESKEQFLKIPESSNLVLHDWYWSKEIYQNWLTQAGFTIDHIYESTISGLSEHQREEFEKAYNFKHWKNEWDNSPFIIYKTTKI
jgi:ubiquinone/menaquinone biosynthesis C-methylase UbiE